jgi:hypothetical protein
MHVDHRLICLRERGRKGKERDKKTRRTVHPAISLYLLMEPPGCAAAAYDFSTRISTLAG